MPVFRRTNFIITASGIVTFCKWLYSMPDESRLSLLSSGIPYSCLERSFGKIVLNVADYVQPIKLGYIEDLMAKLYVLVYGPNFYGLVQFSYDFRI